MSDETPVWWAETFGHPQAVPDGTTVTVWCDDAAHPPKRGRYIPETGRWRLFVADFHKPNVLWEPKPQRRAHPGITTSGQWASGRHAIHCRWCKKPLEVRRGKFDAVCDQLATIGHTDVTMVELSAILQTSAEM